MRVSRFGIEMVDDNYTLIAEAKGTGENYPLDNALAVVRNMLSKAEQWKINCVSGMQDTVTITIKINGGAKDT
jgi:hypothetical protein